MIHGGCLCGAVRFTVERFVGPFELAAGLLDEDPLLRPDRHIFVDSRAEWDGIADALPQLTKDELIAMRVAELKAKRERNRE